MASVGTLITPPGKYRLAPHRSVWSLTRVEPTVGFLVPEKTGERFEVDSPAAAAAAFHHQERIAAAELVLHFVQAGDVLHFGDAQPIRPSPPAGATTVLPVHRHALVS